VYETKTIIIVKLGDCKVNFEVLLQVGVVVNGVKESFGKRSDDTLLVVVDYVLEELVYKLYFEVGQVEAGIVVWIELVSDVQNNLVLLALRPGFHKVVHLSVGNVLNLRMRSDEGVELKLDLVVDIEVSYGFKLLRNQSTL